MLQQLGKLAVSLIVTNWIYAEAVLLFPQIDPLARRVMRVMRIPTHDEWRPIMQSPRGAALERDVSTYIAASPLRGAFVSIGVLDPRARAVTVKGIRGLSAGGGAPAQQARRQQPFLSEEAIFDAIPAHANGSGYQSFGFERNA